VRRCQLPAVIGLAVAELVTVAWAGNLTPQEQRGRQLYRDGVAADGPSVVATLGPGSLTLPATRVPCASCHGPDGVGQPDAGVVPSNITWANLTKPYGLRHANGRSHPPYTADAIVKAVTGGVDPAGNALDPAMPRYNLDGPAADDLVAYLKRLGSDSDQGIGNTAIVVAVVVPSRGAPAGIGSVVERVLAGYFDRINREGGVYNRQIVLKTITFESSGSAVDALRRLMSETEVFSVIAPVVLGQEAALAEFAEQAALPVVGPVAYDRRGAGERQRFTFYLTAGVEDQVWALAKFARTKLALPDAKLAIVSSDGGGAGPGITDALRQQGSNAEAVLSLKLAAGTAVADVVAQLRQATVDAIFYDGGPAGLAALAEEAARSAWRPPILTTGLSITSESFAALREVDARIFVAYPLLGSDQSPEGLEWLHSLQAAYDIPPRHLPVQVAALASARILIEGLQRGGRDLTRSKFVAALATLQNFQTGLVPPISFGPNRRTGVRGAHIVALGRSGKEPGQVWVPLD
jgi:ABC-type branched-subunit amino acid transport system substrate-binding protein